MANVFEDEEKVEQQVADIKAGKFKPEEPVEDEELEVEEEDKDITPGSSFQEHEWDEKKEEGEEEEEVVEEEKKTEIEAEKEVGAEKKLPPDLEAIKKLIETGETSVGKVSGKEIDFSQLTPEERLALQQKGYRFYERMEELSQREDQLKQVEVRLAKDAEYLLKLRDSEQFKGKLSPQGGTTTPKELQDDDMDTDEVKGLKAFGRSMLERVGNLEASNQQQRMIQGEQELLDQIKDLQDPDKGGFPLASTEEIIAVKAMYDQIPVERIALKSHQKYASVDYVDKVFANCPEIKRHYQDKFETEYLARKGKTKTIISRPSSSAKRTVSDSKPKRKGLDYDWDDLEVDLKKRLNEIARMHEEEDLT